MVVQFPSFALTAALTQATAPTDQHLINLLGLHVLAKVFVYVSPPRQQQYGSSH